MDKPELVPTDIIPMVNFAWNQSFVRVEKNLKAIEARGWGPLNYALLNDSQIQATMTDVESKSYALMLKPEKSLNDARSVQQTLSHESTINTAEETISTLTNDPAIDMNYKSIYLKKKVPDTVTIASKLNFSTGRSAAVIQSLLHDADLQKVRQINKTKADKGKDAKSKLESAKKLTAMLNFNTIGCKVGEDSLKVRMKIAQRKKDEEKQVQQNKDKKNNERKRKFDELRNQIDIKNIPLDKLSLSQLKTLCSYKKRKSDKVSISKLKRHELLPLWLSWKDRVVDEVENTIDEQVLMVASVPIPIPEVVGDDRNHDSVISNRHTESDDNVMNVTIV